MPVWSPVPGCPVRDAACCWAVCCPAVVGLAGAGRGHPPGAGRHGLLFLPGMFRPAAGGIATPGGWHSGFLGARRASSGALVNERSALSLATLQNCVTLLAESVGQLPLELYRRIGPDQRVPATDHPLYPLLAQAPNAWQTPFEYREFGQLSAGLRGSAYSYIERGDDGRPTALLPLHPERVQILLSAAAPTPFFRVRGIEGIVPMRHIHHVRWASRDGFGGLSPIELHADTLGYALALGDFANRSFANGPGLAGIITRPAEKPGLSQSATDSLLESWRRKFAGTDNARKVALLQEGMTFEPLKISLVDAELINALKLSSIDIARIYKIPLHMLNMLEAATYNNVENLQIQFVVFCLLPWLRRHEQAMMRDLLQSTERPEYYIEFNVSGLLRGDLQARYASYALARQWGWLSINDIRRLENLPPVAGGDAYLEPLNMKAAGSGARSDTSPAPSATAADIETLMRTLRP